MKGTRLAAASTAVVILGGAGGAFAADMSLPVKAVPISGPAACTSIIDFFTTACQVSAYGVRFYGTIDVDANYSTHGTPIDPIAGPGMGYFPLKNNGARGSTFQLAPNGLSLSNIGVQIKESIGGGWSFIGQLEAGFQPLSMDLANAAGSVQENAGLSLSQQRLAADGGANGKFYNDLGFAGFSHDTWGAITFGRQNDFGREVVFSDDPMGNAYAFSYTGFVGSTAGGGDTENSKSTEVKYRVNVGNLRFGVSSQLGGYSAGNAAQEAFQGLVGGDWRIGPGVLSVDVVPSYTKDAVSEGLSGGLTVTPGTFATSLNLNTPQTLGATISDNTAVMVGGKYTVDRLKLYAGYEWIQFAPPSDRNFTNFVDDTGTLIGTGGLGTINFAAYDHGDKIQQTAWVGARYALTDKLDVAGAWYHADFNQFGGSAALAGGTIAQACAVNNTASGNCHGTVDEFSVLLDWQFAPKWDTYLGTAYSKLGGGQASGFVVDNNWSTTAGVRFRW